MADPSEQNSALKPWDQQPGEPALWYGRFQIYLGLGPTRTLRQAARSLPRRSDRAHLQSGDHWSAYAAIWYWRERAHAWDEHQRELLALSEQNMRRSLHHRRITMIGDTLETICELLGAANLADVDQETARAWLPQLRVFLRDMLVAERQEFEHDFTAADPAAAVPITADDLRAAQRGLEQQGLKQAEGVAGRQTLSAEMAARIQQHGKERTFLVCTGPDPNLLLDLAALRAVRAATGLEFHRLLNPTRDRFSQILRRQRSFHHPIEYIHMAVHAAAAGLELADGPVDGNWLSERLGGVRVLLLASCESDSIGDWLGVVPYVITLSENIPNEDAAALAQHFWHGIGLGHDTDAALDEALAQCPPAISEYVVRHW